MEEERDKNGLYAQDTIVEDRRFKTKIYNYFYTMLNEKKEASFLEIYILLVLETIQLMSYSLADPHLDSWKIKSSTMKTISDIVGIPRISVLMKYLSFNVYLVIFFILIAFSFGFFIFLLMQILFGKQESKLFMGCLTITRILLYPLTIFFFIPIVELILIPLKCENNYVDIVKEPPKCWNGLHYLYCTLGIIGSLLFFMCCFFLSTLYFSPFNYNESSVKINSFNDTVSIIFKYIFVLKFIFIKNNYISIAILLLLSLFSLVEEFTDPSFNNDSLQIMLNIRNFLSFWSSFVLLIAKSCENSKINGIIYLLLFGIPIIIICCILIYKKQKADFDYSTASMNNMNEYLRKTRLLIKLFDCFIEGSKNMKHGNEGNNEHKNDILLKGIIKIHNKSCLNEECPLTKFMQNIGNYNMQKQCLLNYMTIYFNLGLKKFPESRQLLIYFIQFNFSKRFNLNSVRTNLLTLQKKPNNYHDDFIIYGLSQEIKNMRNKISESNEGNNMDQEMDIISQKYQRLKFLIENSTKLYGEFWGIFATNITNNLNTLKLYNLGQKLNLYLNEINTLWDTELKSKKIESENQSIAQLYSRFLREILWNKKKSEEITKKLNDEHQRHHENKKHVDENLQRNNIDIDLENPDYIIYGTSNEKGECNIGQCSSSIVNLLGYMKSEIVGRKIEVLMPKIFAENHSVMLTEAIKKLHSKQHSQRNSFRENDKKMKFIVAKSKMGYLIPLNSKFTIYEDNDFSNSFIIKAQIEAKDPKSIYAYYVLTKPDFSVDAISSSCVYLGLTMDLLNKYVIQLGILVRDGNQEKINFNEKFNEYEEDPKEIVWVFPDLIYPRDDSVKNRNEDIQELINKSCKKKYTLQISVMKYNDEEIIGYVFKFNEINKKKKIDEISQDLYIPHSKKEIIFDMLTLNYIRTILVEEKTGTRNLLNREEFMQSDININKTLSAEKKKKKKDNDDLDEIQESSGEEDKVVEILLTKEKMMELQTKESKEVKNFINLLPFYGNDVALEKHRPTGERYPVGRAHDTLIKIEIGQFLKKIEDKIKNNPELMKRLRGGETTDGESGRSSTGNSSIQSQDKEENNEFNMEFSSDTSTSLGNVFNAKSVSIIKFTSLFLFILFACIMILEFIFTLIHMQSIKNKITFMNNAYKLLDNIVYTKYFTTEAILCNQMDNYTVIVERNISQDEYVKKIKTELATYREEFSTIYGDFTSSSDIASRKDEYFDSNKTVDIFIISNNIETTDSQPFSTAINRIPTTVFYVSTISDINVKMLMSERNCYELMKNCLNGYFTTWKSVTISITHEAKNKASHSLITTLLFILSFILAAVFLLVLWKLLNRFIQDREKPINLFLTIKKKIFEDLKNSSEAFSNKLLNKFFGNEDNEEESQKDYQTNIKINDINIIKFKAPNEYKSTVNKDREHLLNYIKVIVFFILVEVYMTFKYCYTSSNIKNISKYIGVFNITQYSHTDIILSVDIIKSFFFDKTIPILYKNFSKLEDSPFYDSFYEMTEKFEDMFISTSKTNSFLQNKYKDQFTEYNYEDFEELFTINGSRHGANYWKELFDNGFKPISMNVFEKLRFMTLQYFNDTINQKKNNSAIINDTKWEELDDMLTNIIRPFYVNLLNLMYDSLESFMNNSKVVQIAVFITVLALVILAYCIIWKRYEEKLTILLKRSFDLINLIPEEIKYLIVCKLNE